MAEPDDFNADAFVVVSFLQLFKNQGLGFFQKVVLVFGLYCFLVQGFFCFLVQGLFHLLKSEKLTKNQIFRVCQNHLYLYHEFLMLICLVCISKHGFMLKVVNFFIFENTLIRVRIFELQAEDGRFVLVLHHGGAFVEFNHNAYDGIEFVLEFEPDYQAYFSILSTTKRLGYPMVKSLWYYDPSLVDEMVRLRNDMG